VPRSTTADPTLMRELNRAIVVNLIRQEASISRAEIAKRTKLSRSTVSNIITDLMTDGLVREGGSGASQGGRRPIMVSFNYQAGAVVGVELAANRIVVVVTDLDARVRCTLEETFAITDGPDTALTRVASLARKAVAQAGVDFEKVIGLGLGVPGPMNFASGTMVSPPLLPGWDGVPLRPLLEQRLGIPVYADNDANLAAIGERWRGAGQGEDDLVYVQAGIGIGCGLILRGEIYRGKIGSAGEIGHVTVDENGPTCRCGSLGCLEAVAGASAVVQQADMARVSANGASLAGLPQEGPQNIEGMVEAARHGDLATMELFRKAGRSVGIVVADLVNALNPGLVIVDGIMATAGTEFIDAIRQVVNERALEVAASTTRVIRGQLGREATALGAVTLVLQEAFRSPGLSIPTRL
jgi:glucokinase-like ROK family protein